jgi:L-amino acid N-acyltransferase YncA
MELRPATTTDWPAIWPIWHTVVSAGRTYAVAPETDEPAARALWLPGPPAETWVAVDGGIVGTALLKPNQAGPGSHVANAGFMVAESAAGRGVGRALAVRILDRARELGYHAMQFNAVVASNTRAVALWQSLGFAIAGTLPEAFRHPELGLVDLYVMYRKL